MKVALDKRIIWGFLSALAILIFVGLITWRVAARAHANLHAVSRSHEVIAEINTLLSLLEELSSEQRGYAITGDASFLNEYQIAAGKILPQIDKVRQLTLDNALQQEHLSNLRQLAMQRMAIAEKVIDARAISGLEAAQKVVQETGGREVMGKIQAAIVHMRKEEHRTLEKRELSSAKTARNTTWVLGGGYGLSFALLAAAFFLVRSEYAERLRAEQAALQLASQAEEARCLAEAATAEAKRSAEALRRSNAELEQFAYVASHDLQEPLRAVAGCAQLLKSKYGSKLDSKADELIAHQVEGAQRMQNLINDLLAFSRVSSRGAKFEMIDINSLLQTVFSNLQTSIQEKRAEILHDSLPVIQADRMQMGQLFQNLLGNALKYSDAQPKIQIRATREGDYWHFSVSDNGIGIDPQYYERIFGIFQRLHTRMEYSGTGIGLAICKKIVELHGGRIWVEPQPPKGSIFHFTIAANR